MSAPRKPAGSGGRARAKGAASPAPAKRAKASTASPDGRATPPRHLRSEGQRQLLALEESGAEVARRIGSTRASVSAWRKGVKVPAPDARRTLEAVYGIPLRAWDSRPSGLEAALSAPATPAEAAPEAAAAPSARGSVGPAAVALAGLRALLTTVQAVRRRENLSAGELAKVATTEAQLLERVAQAQRAAQAEQAALEEPAEEPQPVAPAEELVRLAFAWMRMIFLALESHPWHPRDGVDPSDVARNAMFRYGEGDAFIERLLDFEAIDDEAITELVRLAAEPRILPPPPEGGSAGHESDRHLPGYRGDVKRWTEGEHFGRRRKA